VAELLASWDRPTLLAMAEKARAVAIPDATERVAAELVRVAK
jgi:UDP-N-acetylglucosamine--N-acetylmuramyl-(pentapeptide) pyrophosphoryl-undecaprenol N-acetylglucosamine transferase